MSCYSREIAEKINRFLTAEMNWKYEFDEENGLFIFGVELGRRSTIPNITYRIEVGMTEYIVTTTSCIHADIYNDKQISDIEKLLNRIHNGPEWSEPGVFTLDINGDIDYTIIVDCFCGIPPIAKSILSPAEHFSTYGKAITDIINGASVIEAYDGILMDVQRHKNAECERKKAEARIKHIQELISQSASESGIIDSDYDDEEECEEWW